MILLRKFVAFAPDGANDLRLGGIFLYFNAQAVNVGIDGVFVAFVLIPPYLLQQCQPRKDLSGMAGKEIEQFKFG